MSDRNVAVEQNVVRDVSPAYQVESETSSPHDVPLGYKRTEVGVIPEDWGCVEISQLLSDISMGPFGSDIKVSNFVDNGVPVLDGFNVRQERLLDDFSKFVTKSKAKSLKKAVASRGDVVITHRGTIGQVSYIPYDSEFDEYVISQSQFRARFNPSVLPQWVVIYFLSDQGSHKLLEGKGHTGVPAIAQPTTTFRKLRLPLPSSDEQRAIVAALSDADALIESLDRLIAKKRAIKQATMQQLLTGQTRLPGFEGGWETKRLGELVDIFGGGTPSSSVPEYWDGGVLWCTPTDITEMPGKYLGTTNRTISEEGLRSSAAILLPKGALLLCTRATIGELKLAEKPISTNQGFKSLVCKKGISNEFMYYKLLILKQAMLERASGSTFLEISKQAIADLEIEIPDSSEQDAIAEVLSDLDTEIEALERRRDKARQIKQGMMQQLLTGKVRLVKPEQAA